MCNIYHNYYFLTYQFVMHDLDFTFKGHSRSNRISWMYWCLLCHEHSCGMAEYKSNDSFHYACLIHHVLIFHALGVIENFTCMLFIHQGLKFTDKYFLIKYIQYICYWLDLWPYVKYNCCRLETGRREIE